MNRLILLLAVALLITPLGLAAQPPGAKPSPSPVRTPLLHEDTWIFRKAWQRPIAAPFSDTRLTCIHNLRLYMATSDSRLWQLPMKADSADGEPTPVDLTGVPAGLTLTAIGTNPTLEQLFLAGTSQGQTVVYAGKFAAEGAITGWKQLAPFKEPSTNAIVRIHPFEEWTLFVTDTAGGWAGNTGAAADQFSWFPIPQRTAPRTAAATMMLRGTLYLVGGTEGGKQGEMESLLFDKKTFSPWKRTYLPTPPALADTIGVGFGSAVYAAPRVPTDDMGTTQSLYLATDMVGGQLTPWRPILLEQPAAPLRNLTVDPGHKRLLVFSEPDDKGPLRLTAYKLPAEFFARARTEEEIMFDITEQSALNPPRISASDALEEARKKEQFLLVITSTGDKKEDVYTRAAMGSNQYRYMTRDMVTTYLTGSEAAAFRDQQGVKDSPAYFLLNKDGLVVSKFSGKVAKGADLFNLTAPAREPVPETPTPAPVP